MPVAVFNAEKMLMEGLVMDINHIKMVIGRKMCPSCGLGTIRKLNGNKYMCDYTKCNAVFDYSALSEPAIKMLLSDDKK